MHELMFKSSTTINVIRLFFGHHFYSHIKTINHTNLASMSHYETIQQTEKI